MKSPRNEPCHPGWGWGCINGMTSAGRRCAPRTPTRFAPVIAVHQSLPRPPAIRGIAASSVETAPTSLRTPSASAKPVPPPPSTPPGPAAISVLGATGSAPPTAGGSVRPPRFARPSPHRSPRLSAASRAAVHPLQSPSVVPRRARIPTSPLRLDQTFASSVPPRRDRGSAHFTQPTGRQSPPHPPRPSPVPRPVPEPALRLVGFAGRTDNHARQGVSICPHPGPPAGPAPGCLFFDNSRHSRCLNALPPQRPTASFMPPVPRWRGWPSGVATRHRL